MAVDRYTIEYHLTDNGWVSGSTTFFGKEDHHVDRPANAHATWIEETVQGNRYDRESSHSSRTWVNPNSTQEKIDALLRAHGSHP